MSVQNVNYKTGGKKLKGDSSENFDQNIVGLFIVLKWVKKKSQWYNLRSLHYQLKQNSKETEN